MFDHPLIAVLLAIATLLPLISFVAVLIGGKWMKQYGGSIATGAIGLAGFLSFWAMGIWLLHHPRTSAAHGSSHGEEAADHDNDKKGEHAQEDKDKKGEHAKGDKDKKGHKDAKKDGDQNKTKGKKKTAAKQAVKESQLLVSEVAFKAKGDSKESNGSGTKSHGKDYYAGDFYVLAKFGPKMKLTVGYYIDSLTVCMFCMVTLIATCIHVYATGYMNDELVETYTDHEVTTADGSHLQRAGRYPRFFQYMSLFCFSMLGLVLAGNIALVFVFWELVGICSYFLIGFYVERKSASNAANKAFIVNRVGDFGMLIGLMCLWAGVGTFAFGDKTEKDDQGHTFVVEQGIFSQVRPDKNHNHWTVPDRMVQLSARREAGQIIQSLGPDATDEQIAEALKEPTEKWRSENKWEYEDGTALMGWWRSFTHWLGSGGHGYWLMVVAGIGIFCGCVGKSAQFPLHVWLPDAMEGPTPVSALVHSATMVAAGVYLVGRFYPVFAPEVLLVIAITGCITLFMAATIAITATDIKRVLAYSTVSQLGYMMMALGVGGWVAGMMHLITHAFFKSLLFLGSGSVIHAVHTNEMPQMGGLLKKMPWTGFTMLIGCMAIAGAGVPFIIGMLPWVSADNSLMGLGMSGFYSKDLILEQSFSFMKVNGNAWGAIFFFAAAGGAAITAFYMFRMWFLTFVGKPRDEHRYEHAHESPKVMYVPLVVLAVFAIGVAWSPTDLNLNNLLEQSRPDGLHGASQGKMVSLVWPDEHDSHEESIVIPVALTAVGTALSGFALAAMMYGLGFLSPQEVRAQFSGIYTFLLNKWWFDELYEWLFVKPAHVIARIMSAFDRRWIDGFIHAIAGFVKVFARVWDRIVDQGIIDGVINSCARWCHGIGLSLRAVQTGKIRQYVMFIVLGALTIFVLITFFWSSPTLAR